MARVLRITDAASRRVSNPIFDNWTSGAPDNWTATGTPTASQVISEGTIQTYASAYALSIQNASTAAVRGYYQDVTDLTPGQTYYISVYVKPVSGILRLYAWDGGGTANAVYVESAAEQVWQHLIVEKQANTGGIRIGLIAFDAGSQGVFDLVQIATFNIEFIEGVYDTHFRVTNWEIQVPDYKGGGVFSSSPVAEGQKLIDGYWDNVTQTISFHLRGDTDQNTAANKLGELFKALQAARDFSKTSWVRDPVYMQFKAESETNYRYAFIANARIPQLADMYSIDFKQLVMKDLDLIVEHPVAFGMPPGEGAPVLNGTRMTYNSQNYGYYDGSGVAEDTAELAYFAMRHNTCNITNMHQGTGGANQIGGSFPRAILTNSTTTYFGISTSVANAGPFNSIVFYVSRARVGGTGGVWQYYNGSVWSTMTTVYDSSSHFSLLGRHIIVWQDTPMIVSPGGGLPTGHWIRFTPNTSYTTTPQIDREIFAINKNYIEFPLNSVNGHIPAIAGFLGENLATAAQQVERVIGGLRSLSRGSDFQSIINLGNKQNHSDITINYDTGVSSQYDDVGGDAERSTAYVARSAAASEKYVEVVISGDLAREYIGEFRSFLVAYKPNTATVTAHLEYKLAEGMPFEVNKEVYQGATTSFFAFIIELGQVVIDPEGDSDLFGNVTFRVYTTPDTASDFDRHALILIPVDEYQFDSDLGQLFVNSASRWAGADSDMAVFGSVQFPKDMGRSHFVLVDDTDLTQKRAKWITKANGPMILQSGEKQRMYFIAMNNRGDEAWQFQPTITISAKPLVNPRYLGMRGSS